MSEIQELIERLKGMAEFYSLRAASPSPVSMTDMGVFEREEIKRAASEAVDALRSARNEALEEAARLVEAEGNCRHVDHVQGFCECQPKADAIRSLKQDQASDSPATTG